MIENTDQLDDILDEELFEQDEDEYSHDNDYDSDYYSDSSLDDELQLINAQLQWEQSLVQLQKLVNFVVLPLVGKFIGRRLAGYIWKKAWDYLY